MNLSDSILLDLVAGQSTADSTAGRLQKSCLLVEKAVEKLHSAGLVDSVSISKGTLTAWRLTVDGKEAVKKLQSVVRGKS